MAAISVQHGFSIEQLPIYNIKIRAVGFHEHVLGCSGIGTVETDSDFDVIEHTEDVVDRVIAHGLDGQLAEAHATHGTYHLNNGSGRGVENFLLIVRFVIDKGNILRFLVLSQ